MKWVGLLAVVLIAAGIGLTDGSIGSALIACGMGLVFWLLGVWFTGSIK